MTKVEQFIDVEAKEAMAVRGDPILLRYFESLFPASIVLAATEISKMGRMLQTECLLGESELPVSIPISPVEHFSWNLCQRQLNACSVCAFQSACTSTITSSHCFSGKPVLQLIAIFLLICH